MASTSIDEPVGLSHPRQTLAVLGLNLDITRISWSLQLDVDLTNG